MSTVITFETILCSHMIYRWKNLISFNQPAQIVEYVSLFSLDQIAPLLSPPLVLKMKKYMSRGQLMVMFMLVLVLFADSIYSPQFMLDLVENYSIFKKCCELIYANTIFLNAAIFAVVFKDAGRE